MEVFTAGSHDSVLNIFLPSFLANPFALTWTIVSQSSPLLPSSRHPSSDMMLTYEQVIVGRSFSFRTRRNGPNGTEREPSEREQNVQSFTNRTGSRGQRPQPRACGELRIKYHTLQGYDSVMKGMIR